MKWGSGEGIRVGEVRPADLSGFQRKDLFSTAGFVFCILLSPMAGKVSFRIKASIVLGRGDKEQATNFDLIRIFIIVSQLTI